MPPSLAVPSARTIRPRIRAVNALGLLGDLLEHEVREPAPLDVGEAEGNLLDALADGGPFQGPRLEAVPVEERRFPVVEVDDVPRVRHERGGIACNERAVFSQPQDNGAAVPGHEDFSRFPRVHRRNAVRADKQLHRPEESRGKIRLGLEELLDEVGDHFRIGFTGEGVTLALERRAEGSVVFDDAVVDDGHPPRAVSVGMSVCLRGGPVRRPPGVGNACHAGSAASQRQPIRIHPADPPDAPQEGKLAVARDAEPPGIVSTVLEALDPFHQHAGGRALAHVAEDSAHWHSSSPDRACDVREHTTKIVRGQKSEVDKVRSRRRTARRCRTRGATRRRRS